MKTYSDLLGEKLERIDELKKQLNNENLSVFEKSEIKYQMYLKYDEIKRMRLSLERI